MSEITSVPAGAPLKKGNQILCEDKHGNRRYMGSIEVEHATGSDGQKEWWPVKSNERGRVVKKEATDASGGGTPPAPEQPTAASVIEKIKATKTEEEARAVVGDDTRKTVIGAMEKHIERLKASAEEGGNDTGKTQDPA